MNGLDNISCNSYVNIRTSSFSPPRTVFYLPATSFILPERYLFFRSGGLLIKLASEGQMMTPTHYYLERRLDRAMLPFALSVRSPNPWSKTRDIRFSESLTLSNLELPNWRERHSIPCLDPSFSVYGGSNHLRLPRIVQHAPSKSRSSCLLETI